ncbi:DUF1161 domain-containing protein [Orbaceae bacterium ESL0727]|nr:DUF1161 domain-containing protein [Orbaceae bacterium ESL0727]
MKKLCITLLLGLPLMASAASNCDEISASIAEKIHNNGVPTANFELKLIPSDQAQQQIEGQIVGSCDRGQQNIVYLRIDEGAAPVASKEATAAPSEPNKVVEKVETQVETKVESTTPVVAPTTTAPEEAAPAAEGTK